MNRNTSKVRNIKSYLLTTLYNSFSTIEHYYRAEVNHDKEDLLKEKNSILNKLRKLQYRQKQEQLTERRQKQHNRDDWDMEL